MPPTLGPVRADHLTNASPIATYLDARKRPALWYQADPGGADPATFLYYLEQAARRAESLRKRRCNQACQRRGHCCL